jgi:hypothetical protein
MKPSARFLNALNQLHLKVRHAAASRGIGERPSRQKGSGINFADYRAYVPGDDTRHLDARLHARLGGFFVREYEVMKQLPVTILIDGSRSMQQGPLKLDLAKWLANSLGYITLSGGDVVRLAFWSGRRLMLSPRFSGAGRANRMFSWVETAVTEGQRPFDDALAEAASQVPRSSLLIVLSDFWLDDLKQTVRSMASTGAELWAFHILAEEEVAPPYHEGGVVNLVDSETGQEVVLALDRAMLAAYDRALVQWRGELSEALRSIKGRMFEMSTTQDREKLLLGLRRHGVLG